MNLSSSAEETIGTVDGSSLRSPLKYTPQPPGHNVCGAKSLEFDRNSEPCPAKITSDGNEYPQRPRSRQTLTSPTPYVARNATQLVT